MRIGEITKASQLQLPRSNRMNNLLNIGARKPCREANLLRAAELPRCKHTVSLKEEQSTWSRRFGCWSNDAELHLHLITSNTVKVGKLRPYPIHKGGRRDAKKVATVR